MAHGLEGRVVDMDGNPVARAEVSILTYPGSTLTDGEGRFVWSPEPSLPFNVLVILPGGQFTAPVLIESLPEDGPIEIRVTPFTENVTVTSDAAPSIDGTPAAANRTISKETIEERHPARLTDAIQAIPGAGSLSDLHTAVPSLRGLARGRTLLLIDGARVTTERRAGPSASYLDPFFLDGLEVSRGPGSVGYGSDAFGGVIHARTRRVDPGGPTRVRFRGALGAGLPEATAGAEVTHGFDEGGLVLQGHYRSFSDYRSPEGEILNSQASDRGFLARVGRRLGQGEFSVGWQSNFGRDTGRPDDRGEEVQTSYPIEDSHRLTLSYELEPTAGFRRIRFEGFWGSYRLVTERSQFDDRSLSLADVDANDFSFRGSGSRVVGNGLWTLGVDINGRYGLRAMNGLTLFDGDGNEVGSIEEVAIDNARRADVAGFTSLDLKLGSRWTLGAGLRADRVTTESDGGFFGSRSTDNGALSGYGSMRVELSRGLSVTGQLAHGFRDPTLSDRYFRGISGRGLVTGNPRLDPERATQFDAALRYTSGRVSFGLYGYFYRLTELIQRIEVRPDRFVFVNRGEADVRGIELEVQSQLTDTLRLEVTTQLARGSTRDDDEPVDDIPGPNLKMALWKSFTDGFSGEIRFVVFAEDDLPGPTEKLVPSYTSFDVGAGLEIRPGLTLRVLVRNLFDQAFPVSPDRRAVLAPGISGVVSLVAGF